MPPRKKPVFNEKPAFRVPPYSAEAEAAVLGAILLDAPRSIDLCYTIGITEASFWIAPNRTLFETMIRMNGIGKPVDLITVMEELRNRGELDGVGGAVALERLVDGTPSVAHAEYYATILHEKHLLRRIITAAENAQEKCYAPDRSIELIVSETEQEVLSISENQSETTLDWNDALKLSMGRIDQLLQRKDGISGLATGFKNIDRKVGGMRNAEMIVLAARPSMGKTSLAMNICENVALGTVAGGKVKVRDAVPVGIFSCEMSTDSLITRLVCSRARVSLQSVMAGYVNKQDANTKITRAASDFMNAPIYVDDTGGLDVIDLRARARRMKKKHGIGLIMIDYLQLLHSRDYAAQGRQLETSSISSHIKAMAKELDVPVLVLSQLSRAPETREKDGRPRISDLRDSGSIEQDADVVMLLWRPSYYERNKRPADGSGGPVDDTAAEVDIGKNRNGPVGKARLIFESAFTQFSDAAPLPDEED